MTAAPSSRRVVLVSFLVNLLDVGTNLLVMLVTGSAVVFAEMAHGIADSLGSALLVVGERRSKRPPDDQHPLGYKREAFFWALLSALAMLLLGAGLSAWRAVTQLVDPHPLRRPELALLVVGVAVVTNGYAVWLAARKLRSEHGSLRAAFRWGGRPMIKASLLRDATGTLSSLLALIALGAYLLFDLVVIDALGALAAAILMAVFAGVLTGQARELITGRAIPTEAIERLRRVVLDTEGVTELNELVAVYMGDDEVLLELDLDLAEDLDTSAIELLLDRLFERTNEVLPKIESLRVDLNSPVPRRGSRSVRGHRDP